MITPFAPGVPLRLGRCAPKTPFHPRGKSIPAQPSAETLIYPEPLANPNCRHWKGIIVVDQLAHVQQTGNQKKRFQKPSPGG